MTAPLDACPGETYGRRAGLLTCGEIPGGGNRTHTSLTGQRIFLRTSAFAAPPAGGFVVWTLPSSARDAPRRVSTRSPPDRGELRSALPRPRERGRGFAE